METEEQHIKRVSEKVQKIMQEEGVVFDVNMVPQVRMVVIPKTPEEVIEEREKTNDPTT